MKKGDLDPQLRVAKPPPKQLYPLDLKKLESKQPGLPPPDPRPSSILGKAQQVPRHLPPCSQHPHHVALETRGRTEEREEDR